MVKTRRRRRRFVARIWVRCAWCGKRFRAKTRRRKTHSDACRFALWKAQHYRP